MAKLKLMLVDDHAVVRGALRALLEGQEGLEVVGEAGDLAAAKKRQNKITEYRKMLQAWKDAGVITDQMQVGAVLMALITTAMTGPLVDRFLPKQTA